MPQSPQASESPLGQLSSTFDLWFPPLRWLLRQFSNTPQGQRVDNFLKHWIKDPDAEAAFRDSMKAGINRYSVEGKDSAVAQTVAETLLHLAKQGQNHFDRVQFLYQIFDAKPDAEVLSEIVRKYAFGLEGKTLSHEQVTAELEILILNYLRPAFMANSYFTNRVGFAEVIGVLRDIQSTLNGTHIDFAEQRHFYNRKMIELYKNISWEGISPKVGNETVAMPIDEVFIKLNLITQDDNILEAETLLKDKLSKSKEISKILHYIPRRSFANRYSTRMSRGDYWLDTEGQDLISIEKVLISNRIVIQGDPGSGKSTLTQYITWAMCSKRNDLIGEELAEKLPIRLRAAEFGTSLGNGTIHSLFDYVLEKESGYASLIEYSLFQGNCMLLVDGLDEIGNPSLRQLVKDSVDEFIADPIFAQNNMVITSRIIGYERSGLIGQLPHFLVTELDTDQIEQFIESWYRALGRKLSSENAINVERDQLIHAIEHVDGIRRMASNPLMLTIIALIKRQGGALPDQRIQLYDVAAQTLIRNWPLIHRNIDLEENLVREWLAPVAFTILAEKNDLIDEYSLKDLLVERMRFLKETNRHAAQQRSEELLSSVSAHSGILLPRGIDGDGRTLYGFLHRTFAEYLTATLLAGKFLDGELELIEYAHEPYWREVILLIAGHLGMRRRQDAGKLVTKIRSLKSSPYESFINRDLFLTIAILADGVPVGPATLVEDMIREFMSVANTPTHFADYQTCRKLMYELFDTEYKYVTAELLVELADDETLLSYVNPEHYNKYENIHNRILKLLDSDIDSVRVNAAAFIVGCEDNSRADELLKHTLQNGTPEMKRIAFSGINSGSSNRLSVANLLFELCQTSEDVLYLGHGCIWPIELWSVIQLADPAIAARFDESFTHDIADRNLRKMLLHPSHPSLFNVPSDILLHVSTFLHDGDPNLQLATCRALPSYIDSVPHEVISNTLRELMNSDNPNISFQAALIVVDDIGFGNERQQAMQIIQNEFVRIADVEKIKIAYRLHRPHKSPVNEFVFELIEPLVHHASPIIKYRAANLLASREQNRNQCRKIALELYESEEKRTKLAGAMLLITMIDEELLLLIKSEIKNWISDTERVEWDGPKRSFSEIAREFIESHLTAKGALVVETTQSVW